MINFFSNFLLSTADEAGFNRQHLGYYKESQLVEVGTSRSYLVDRWEVVRLMSGNTLTSLWWLVKYGLSPRETLLQTSLLPSS